MSPRVGAWGAQRKGKLLRQGSAAGHSGSSVPLGHKTGLPLFSFPSKDNKVTAF